MPDFSQTPVSPRNYVHIWHDFCYTNQYSGTKQATIFGMIFAAKQVFSVIFFTPVFAISSKYKNVSLVFWLVWVVYLVFVGNIPKVQNCSIVENLHYPRWLRG